MSFRPLDGESISKLNHYSQTLSIICFRPLDGESISKLTMQRFTWDLIIGFRPLDGESISKLIQYKNILSIGGSIMVSVP